MAILKLNLHHADKRLIAELPLDMSLTEPPRPFDKLHVCSRCDSDLVQPSEWVQADAGHWQLRLQCPNCGWSRRGTFGGHQLTALEDQLDGGFAVLLRDLKQLTQARMTEEIERFAGALETDLLLPEDF